jgi:elongation factor Ts
MEISAAQIKELRDKSGAGVMDCRNTLVQTQGNFNEALEILKQKSLTKIQKRSERVVALGLVETYTHTGGRVAAMVELNCETDFVARTEVFKELAHNIALQITAQEPICISKEDMPADTVVLPEVACLLLQPFIKTPELTIQDLINDAKAKTGENIKVARFARFELGRTDCQIAGVKAP